MLNNFDKLKIIGREKSLLELDISARENELNNIVQNSSFLVLGAAGTIGKAVTIEIFKRGPKKLHAVDISENNLAELVRDLRSSHGYIKGEFKTFAIDVGSDIYDAYWERVGVFDYVLNLSALKHVRSEKDEFTLMRMIQTNILNTEKTIVQCIEKGVKNYFCVSTDKAANPVNLMGASKKIMELFANEFSDEISISMARFANVAFSDGSLLSSYEQRIRKRQPIVAPNDVLRYFIVEKEAGELCLLAAIFGDNCDIFYPKLINGLKLESFSVIADRYLRNQGYEPVQCATEEEARSKAAISSNGKEWPCFFTNSDTTGEKPYEEFFTKDEKLDLESFYGLGVIKKDTLNNNKELCDKFKSEMYSLINSGSWSKQDILSLINEVLNDLNYRDIGKYLDSKM